MRRIDIMKKAAFKAIMMAMVVSLLCVVITRTVPAADGPCDGIIPSIIAITPSNGRADVVQDLLVTGMNFKQPDGTANVTSIFAVEVGNPANVIQASSFVILNANLADAIFSFGSGNVCKTFRIIVNGPCGASPSTSAAEFKTTCPTPAQRIAMLIDSVAALQASDVLSKKQAKSLTKKLNKALNKLESGNEAAAINQLHAFIDAVAEMGEEGVFTTAQSQPLIDQANSIIAQINQ